MAIEGAVINISDFPVTVVGEVGKLGLWLQALGIVVVLTIIFDVVAFFYNRKRLKEIAVIKKDMVRIEGKIDKILNKKR